MKTTLFFFTGIFCCQYMYGQDIKYALDRCDTLCYLKQFPENLKDIYGKWGAPDEKKGYVILGKDGKGIYRYPTGGFASGCDAGEIKIIDFGILCDKNGAIATYTIGERLFYILVFISDSKEFEACTIYVKTASIWSSDIKLLLGRDTGWEKQ